MIQPDQNRPGKPEQSQVQSHVQALPIGQMYLVENLEDLKLQTDSALVTCPFCKFTGMTLVTYKPNCVPILCCIPILVCELSHDCSRCRQEITRKKTKFCC